jgi:hypothetical protein
MGGNASGCLGQVNSFPIGQKKPSSAIGLKEANESVEQIGELDGIPASTGSGCPRIFVILVAAFRWGCG